MPRSQKMTVGGPLARQCSPASSHSLTVAAMYPGLSRTQLSWCARPSPAARSSVCWQRANLDFQIGDLGHGGGVLGAKRFLLTTFNPWASAAWRNQARAFFAVALERVGRGSRLKPPPRREAAPARAAASAEAWIWVSDSTLQGPAISTGAAGAVIAAHREANANPRHLDDLGLGIDLGMLGSLDHDRADPANGSERLGGHRRRVGANEEVDFAVPTHLDGPQAAPDELALDGGRVGPCFDADDHFHRPGLPL